MLGFQLIVNGLLTGLPVVRYRADAIIGWRVAYAPVEDLLFGFALVLLTLTGWVGLGRRARTAHELASPRAATQPRRGRADGHASGEDVVVGALDLVEDAAVERHRGSQTGPRGRIDKRDALDRPRVDRASPGDLVGEQRPDRIVDDAAVEPGPVDAVPAQRLLGQIDAAPVEILGDIAQEVGELKRDPELAGALTRLVAISAAGEAQNGQHLPADNRRRTLHVTQ